MTGGTAHAPGTGDAAHAPGPPAGLAATHLVGVGGAGMSGIAKILLARGARVTGSDAKDSRTVAALRALGAAVRVGHAADALPPAGQPLDALVVSAAIPADNPEVLRARERDVPVLPRAEVLARLMADRTGVAVAGTHGKTTTTSMLASALQRCGADPSFAVGAALNEAGSNGHHGSGPVFVAEADESDGSFLLLRPDVAVVTNVEVDHVDHYADAGAVARAFEAFVDRVAAGGTVVLCADDAGSRALSAPARARGLGVRLYGEAEGADVRLVDVDLSGHGGSADLVVDGRPGSRLSLVVPGRHNLADAAAAVATGTLLGHGTACLVEGLAGYTGARRRFETKGEAAGRRVVDDYAHHPTEVAATLAAARQRAGDGRVLAVFQPHRWSRTAAMADELAVALGAADEVVVMEVYGAGEAPLPGVSGGRVADAVPLPAGRVVFEPSWSRVPPLVAERSRPGDLVLTMGAGDVTVIGGEVLALLAQEGEGA